ncbi:O-antigen ligase family protein [Aurantiacibacter poecillastricola]|uniref:O-antigen ligase family protein n=1 Tax=Aurantiacibacter poecillastricola TaxID=3064385 RepID=UPI00273FE813|nr:O-antigen ligase family protein [Aurantiacibacter sp. 219JJ12-13]MDP5263208.1 O-antigen ligase family protein [Aurantiacibacter sp. 219JJ12-13]
MTNSRSATALRGRTSTPRRRHRGSSPLGFENLPVQPLAITLVMCLCMQTLGAVAVMAELILLAAIVAIRWRLSLAMIAGGALFLALPLWAIMSTAWSPVPETTLRYAIQLLVTAMIGIVLARALPRDRLPLVVFLGIGIALALGLLSGRTGPSTEGAVLIGLTGSKNQMAYVSLFWLLSALSVAMSRPLHVVVRIAGLVCVPIAVFLLWQANAATALVSAAILVPLLIVVLAVSFLPPAGRLYCLLAALACAGAALTALPQIEQEADEFRSDVLGKDPRLTGRTLLWKDADALIAQEPVLGFGYKAIWLGPVGPGLLNRYGQTDGRAYHFHDTFRELRADLGWVGFILFTVPLLIFLVRGGTAMLTQIDTARAFALVTALAVLIRIRTELVVGPFLIDYVLLITGLTALSTPFLAKGPLEMARTGSSRLRRGPRSALQ